MKNPFTTRHWLTGLFVFLMSWSGLSPVQASAHRMQILQKRVQKIVIPGGSLSHALSIVESKASVSLAYDENTIRAYRVEKSVFSETTVGQVLANMLSKFPQLQFEEKYNTIVIYPNLRYQTQINPMAVDSTQLTINGSIKDDQGQALTGVTVIVKGTNIGAISDAMGRYSIRVPAANAVLVFSFIGYTSTEIVVGGRTSIDVSMVNDVQSLTEMVVVGYGSQRRNEVVGAVSTVSVKEVNSRNYNSAAEVLQGTVPGITVINNGGDPTAQPSINIRGIGSINGESPLLVVDGVIFLGSFNSINPNDIGSISVLKDAAASIYGARASGGVILITTKKGTAGKYNVNLSYQQGFQQVAKTLKALNAAEFADVVNKVRTDAGLPQDPAFDPATFPDARTTKTVWMDEIFQTGKIYNINGSISGGSEKTSFFMSGGYRKNEGILLNTHSDRFTARLNSTHQLLKQLKFGENISYSVNNGQGANTTSAYTGAVLGAIFYPPNATVYKEDGSGQFGGVPAQYPGSYGDVINPVAYLKRLDNNNPVSNLFVNPYLEWEIISGLKFRSNWGYTRIKNDLKRFNTRILEPGKIFDFNELIQSSSTFQSLLNEQTLQWEHTFAQRHNLNVLVGHTYEDWRSEYFSLTATNFNNEDLPRRYLNNSNSPIALGNFSGTASVTRLESYLSRLNYSFGGKYFLTAILRRDGTSKLTSSNRWRWYPSVSAGWLISQEPFMQALPVISTLKLRASMGRIGNLGTLVDYLFSLPLTPTQSLFGNPTTVQTGFAETEQSNTALVWEESEQKNIGLDFGLGNDQWSGSVDVFQKNNRKMLLSKITPANAGTPRGQKVNAGNVQNRGVELGLTYRKSTGAFQFDVTANATYLKNEVKQLYEETSSYQVGPSVRSLPLPNIVRVGDPYGAFFGYKTDGLFRSDDAAAGYVNKNGVKLQPNAKGGDLKFTDTNNDGVIDSKDQVVLGNSFPKWTYSLNGNFSFKGFDLNLFFQAVNGIDIFNAVKYTGLNASFPGYNLLSDVKNAWTPQNPDSNIPRLSYRDANNNFGRISDFYIENGSYLRLKSLTLGYTVPSAWVKGARPRIYFTGQNLFTITKYSGMDPEVGLNNFGMDLGLYPLSRVYMFGVDVNF